jgi:hypothetical protein
MAPAFSSARQAAAFALLLLVFLLLPALFGKNALPPREEIYSSVPLRMGPYPWLHRAIFQDKGDIDIAFMGASIMYLGIDTPYVQAALTKDLGRNASVISAAWFWGGFDPLYFIAQDLLEHRKVNTIVFIDVTGDTEPHGVAPYWFRFGDNAEALKGMPLAAIPCYYFASILGMPRNLLSLVRPNSPDYLFSTDRLDLYHIPHPYFTAEDPSTRLGSLSVKLNADFSPFTDYTPVSQVSPSDACVYSPATAASFKFSNEPMAPLQLDFARKFAALARMHGTRLVLITIPTMDPNPSSFVEERDFWPQTFDSDIAMAGIPRAKLLSGIPPQNVPKLFFNRTHLNKNGQEYFTKLITPALLKIYETQTKH